MKAKKKAPYWVEFVFDPASTPKRYPDVRRFYVKAGCFCIELPDKDEWGRPIVRRIPMEKVFWVDTPHEDHVGAEQR